MEDNTSISKLEELTIKYQKKAESSRDWVHHLQVVCYEIIIKDVLLKDTNCCMEMELRAFN